MLPKNQMEINMLNNNYHYKIFYTLQPDLRPLIRKQFDEKLAECGL